MVAVQEELPKRRWRVVAWATGALVALGALAATSWPSLVEGTARDRTIAALERKFDVVELGCFILEKDHLTLCDVHLEKDTVRVDIEELVVNFQVHWSLKPQAVVDQAVAQGGTLAGELDDILALRSSSSTTPAAGSDGRLVLEEAELTLENLQLDILHHGLEFTGTASATSPTPAGPVELELVEFSLLEEGGVLASASKVTTSVAHENPFPLELHVAGAEARHEKVVIKDVEGQLTLESEELEQVSLDLHGQTGQGQSWGLKGVIDRAREHVDIHLEAQDIRPSQLPGAHLLPLVPDQGLVSGNLSIVGSRKKVRFEGTLLIDDVHVDHPKLARTPVVIDTRLEARGEFDFEARELKLERASIALGEDRLVATVSGRAHHAEVSDEREYELQVKLESVPCQPLLEAAPPGLLPALAGFELGGHTSVDLTVVMKMDDPEATVLEGGIDIDSCQLVQVPPTVASLRGPFSHVVKMKNGQTITRLLGPGAQYYTPLERIPGSVSGAVLSTEDGGFWRHDGFISSQFEASLKRNIELGEFRRGASTITMQMVKNVLLTQEKTVSRKLQELFLTWVVERELSKQRIMEIYLNVVEFGPGVYGIGDASEHYFGKVPLELTSLEAAFLATLLPRPVERHEMWCRGELTPGHAKYIGKVHRRMLSKGRITQAEYDVAEAAPFVFSRREWAGEKACLANGRRVAEGTHTQGALSGLLLGRPE